MVRTKWFRILGLVAMLGLVTLLSAAPAVAQTNDPAYSSGSTTRADDDGVDAGWLGMLGLLGLLGLKKKKREVREHEVFERPEPRAARVG